MGLKLSHTDKYFPSIVIAYTDNLSILLGGEMLQSVRRWAVGWTAYVRFPVEIRNFSLLRSVQTGSSNQLY
jgi:hypothetical protein